MGEGEEVKCVKAKGILQQEKHLNINSHSRFFYVLLEQ